MWHSPDTACLKASGDNHSHVLREFYMWIRDEANWQEECLAAVLIIRQVWVVSIGNEGKTQMVGETQSFLESTSYAFLFS